MTRLVLSFLERRRGYLYIVLATKFRVVLGNYSSELNPGILTIKGGKCASVNENCYAQSVFM